MELKKTGGERWIFADDLDKPADLEFVDAEERPSKDGKTKIPVFLFVGTHKGFTGDFVLSIWKANYDAVIDVHGTETDKWKTKMLHLEENKGKIVISPIKTI